MSLETTQDACADNDADKRRDQRLVRIRSAITELHSAAFDVRDDLPTISDKHTLDLLRDPLEDLEHVLNHLLKPNVKGLTSANPNQKTNEKS